MRGRKYRRDLLRAPECRILAKQYNINKGHYLSWGLDSEYDEYFGEINEKRQPHGHGIKFFSDGSIYIGDYQNGYEHTSAVGTLQSISGAQYEGNWVHVSNLNYFIFCYFLLFFIKDFSFNHIKLNIFIRVKGMVLESRGI